MAGASATGRDAMTTTTDPRHQAQRGRPGPDRRARRGARRCGQTALDRLLDAGAAARTPASASLLWQAVVGAWPAVARAAARLRREGDARGRRPHHVDRPRRGVRGRGARRRRRGVRLRRGARGRRRLVAGLDGARPQQRARRQAARADHARRARRLPGQRAVGPQPGRPRQPAAGRLRRPRSALLADGVRTPKLRVTADRAAAAPRPARAVHVVRRRARRRARPPTTCWPSTAAARSPSSPGCPSGSRAAAAGATPAAAADGAWRDVLTGRVVPSSPSADAARRPARGAAGEGRMTWLSTDLRSTCGRRARSGSGCRWAMPSSR